MPARPLHHVEMHVIAVGFVAAGGERAVVKQRQAAALSARWKAAAVIVEINHFGTDTEADIEADIS